MARIKDSYLADLKARVAIFDVVSPYVKLKRAGKSWKGLSPFSQEKTHSFYVHPEKNNFKCFSTDNGGDAIRFVQLVENLTFMEAIESLAHRFNFPVIYEHGTAAEARQVSSARSELFRMHEEAASWYREKFLADDENGSFIRDYWTKQRKFPLEIAQEFEVGFAPPQGGLGQLFRKNAYSKEALSASGLFFSRGSERFRGRLMIPIRDSQGRIVAFTARQLEVTPQDDPAREAKYVNSPETPIFRKGNLLFNLDKARLHVGEKKQFLLVEGQLDVMRCWQVGAMTAVGPQGTAFTETQANLIARHQAEGLEILLDGDRAGRDAALRILPITLKVGLEPTFLELPEGEDP
ncbi:MAG: DNA primase, partial [Opitutales bacterium]